MTVPQIMLVEDDESLGFLLKDTLHSYGWNVQLLTSGEKAFTAFVNSSFDLCILDVMLPEKDGFTLAAEIRRRNQHVPIIFLTAKSQTADKIRGFQTGADDYVCKPFSIEEFKYRVEAILKRSHRGEGAGDNHTHLQVGQSMLDTHNLLLTSNGVTTRLTHKEVRLLQIFFRHAGNVIEREVFLKAVWEDDGFFVARSMDVFVSRLRKYLQPDATLRIENIRGIGYILKEIK